MDQSQGPHGSVVETIMGAWSEETFGNDTACDWVGDFLDNPGLVPVSEAIQAVLDSDDYLDSDLACECLAACEVIARMQGRWGVRDAYSEDLDQWVIANRAEISEQLKDLADASFGRILASNSELRELWDEGGRNQEWHDAVADLRQRVRG